MTLYAEVGMSWLKGLARWRKTARRKIDLQESEKISRSDIKDISDLRILEENYLAKRRLDHLDKDSRERLLEEFRDVSQKERHHSTVRWAVTTFFVMASFGIAGYAMSSDNRSWGLLLSLILYWTSWCLYMRHKKLSYLLRDYKVELGNVLGFHSPYYVREKMRAYWKTRKILFCLGIVYAIVVLIVVLLDYYGHGPASTRP